MRPAMFTNIGWPTVRIRRTGRGDAVFAVGDTGVLDLDDPKVRYDLHLFRGRLLHVPANPHAQAVITLTADTDGMGGTTYSVVVLNEMRCTVGAVTDHTAYVSIAVDLDEPLTNEEQLGHVTMHVMDPNAGIGPFQPLGLLANSRSDVAVPVDTGQLPVMSLHSVELHYSVERILAA